MSQTSERIAHEKWVRHTRNNRVYQIVSDAYNYQIITSDSWRQIAGFSEYPRLNIFDMPKIENT